MINYSGNVWGSSVHKDDLSACPTVDDFLNKIQLALHNIYDAMRYGGKYGVLIGNMRKNGEYIPLSDYIRMLCSGVMKEEVIKILSNCSSDNIRYSGNFVPIKHEKLYIFEKTSLLLATNLDLSNFLSKIYKNTWLNIIKNTYRKSRKDTLSLREIYYFLEDNHKTLENKHWQARVRAVLQNERYFKRVERGVFTIL